MFPHGMATHVHLYINHIHRESRALRLEKQLRVRMEKGTWLGLAVNLTLRGTPQV